MKQIMACLGETRRQRCELVVTLAGGALPARLFGVMRVMVPPSYSVPVPGIGCVLAIQFRSLFCEKAKSPQAGVVLQVHFAQQWTPFWTEDAQTCRRHSKWEREAVNKSLMQRESAKDRYSRTELWDALQRGLHPHLTGFTRLIAYRWG
jgi:hypothetical protein